MEASIIAIALNDPFYFLNDRPAQGGAIPTQVDHMAVLYGLSEGKTQQRIARELGIKPTTVWHRVTRMCEHWGCKNATHLIAEAYHRGVLLPRCR